MKEQMKKPSGHDAPIETPAEDLLDGLGVARAMHRVLSTTPQSWSTRIGLFGRWGSGKTSILNLLRTLEEANGAIVVSFSAWSASGETGVISQFYTTLAARLREEQIDLPKLQRVKRIAGKLSSLAWVGTLGRTAAEEAAPLPPAVIKAGSAALDKLGAAASDWAKVGRADLEAIVKLLQGRRVVVFVDDLDRADPRLIPKTLLAMRELLDWPSFAFVLAFDKRAITSALASYSTAFGDDADGFLEKVIDVPFQIPEPSVKQRERLARAAFAACCDLMPQSSIAAISPNLPDQPRRVKIIARMMGALRPALARHSPDEIDWTGLALYLIVKEASPSVGDWIVHTASDKKEYWLIWGSDEEARKKKREEFNTSLTALLASYSPPDDAARVIETAMRLLTHWQNFPKEVISYWVRLAFQEPSFTMAELLSVRDNFASNRNPGLIDKAIEVAAHTANVSQEEASADLLKAALTCYSATLELMASAYTMGDLNSGIGAAEQTLTLLEHLYIQSDNHPLANAAASPEAVVPLLNLVGRWLGWTHNTGEDGLRKREREMALSAGGRCIEPEAVFSSTDPFFNRDHGQDTDSMTEWREEVRRTVAPLVVTRLCARFIETDGMLPVASGSAELGAWLVENGSSLLYTDTRYTDQLLATLAQREGLTDDVLATLSKNARLFLEQVLFKTRKESWGGPNEPSIIHGKCPSILPAAWIAVIRSPVPYRMLPWLRDMRNNLIALGVAEHELPVPPWLAPVEPFIQSDCNSTT